MKFDNLKVCRRKVQNLSIIANFDRQIICLILEMKIIYSTLLPVKGFRAINLFGIVFARKDQPKLDEHIINHESIHTRQMPELGVMKNVLILFSR